MFVNNVASTCTFSASKSKGDGWRRTRTAYSARHPKTDCVAHLKSVPLTQQGRETRAPFGRIRLCRTTLSSSNGGLGMCPLQGKKACSARRQREGRGWEVEEGGSHTLDAAVPYILTLGARLRNSINTMINSIPGLR